MGRACKLHAGRIQAGWDLNPELLLDEATVPSTAPFVCVSCMSTCLVSET
uniref:Uncharacterized protein n=1 Tax=Anguilla anguilla TaxID=7936 RepID=A0A0E9R7D6_ANGAN